CCFSTRERHTRSKRYWSSDVCSSDLLAKSQDVNTALLLLFSFMMLAILGAFMKEHMLTLYADSFTEYIHWEVTEESVMQLLKEEIGRASCRDREDISYVCGLLRERQ